MQPCLIVSMLARLYLLTFYLGFGILYKVHWLIYPASVSLSVNSPSWSSAFFGFSFEISGSVAPVSHVSSSFGLAPLDWNTWRFWAAECSGEIKVVLDSGSGIDITSTTCVSIWSVAMTGAFVVGLAGAAFSPAHVPCTINISEHMDEHTGCVHFSGVLLKEHLVAKR